LASQKHADDAGRYRARASAPIMLRTAVFLNDFCCINGGTARVAIDAARALAESGITVKFLGAVGPVSDRLVHPMIQVTCLNQAELVNFGKKPAVALQGLWNFAAVRAVNGILAGCDRQHTVVNIHGWTKALTTSPIREATKAGFATVLTVHDYFAACPNGAFYDYQTGRICNRRAMSPGCVTTNCDRRNYVHKAYRAARGAIQLVASDFPRCIGHHIVASKLSERLLRPYLAPSARTFQLEHIIDVERTTPVSVRQNRGIVAVGRLEPEKGVEVLVEAARLAGVRITFVGDGYLRPMVEQNAHCEVTGWKSAAQVFDVLRTARALVFPSVLYETFGLAVSEAGALGVPSIVSDISVAAERVIHGQTGWVFKSGEATSLAEQLRALSDDDLVDRIGRAAYEKFWEDAPTKDRYVQALRTIYECVLDDYAKPHP